MADWSLQRAQSGVGIQPKVGQLWWDRDPRRTSSYVRVIAVDHSFVTIARGDKGRKSEVRIGNLQRRFMYVEGRDVT